VSHAAPLSPDDLTRTELYAGAGVTAAITAGLAVPAWFGPDPLAIAVGAVQALLVIAWVIGTALPGRIGGLLIGAGTAAAADIAVLERTRASLSVLLGVLGVAFAALLVHQLARGVVRVRVTESVSGVAALCTAVAALSALIALLRGPDGARLTSAAVLATGVGLVVGYLVDSVLPLVRFSAEVPQGVLGVVLAGAIGAIAGALHGFGAMRVDLAGAAVLGGGTAAVAALVAVGVGYVAQVAQSRRIRFGFLALPYLRAALPFAFAAPVAYLIGLSVSA
jgi:hypothetical protein